MGHGLYQEVIDRDPLGLVPAFVDPRPQRQQGFETAIGFEIEMRNGGLRFHQAAGDGAAHGAMRHRLVRPEPGQLGCGLGDIRLRRRGCDRLLGGPLDVDPDNPSARTRTRHPR